MFVTITISVILSLTALFTKRSKVIAILIFILMFLLFGWNYWNGDYDAYKQIYDASLLNDTRSLYEIGYQRLSYFFKSHEYDFQYFMKFTAFTTLALLMNFIWRYSKLPALATLCFFAVYFPLDYVLLRNFFAFTLVLQGFLFLLLNKNNAKLYFSLFTLLAATIHSTTIFYLIFLAAHRNRKLNLNRILFFTFLISFIYIFFRNYFINIFLFINTEKFETYQNTINQFILFTGYQILNMIFIKYFTNRSTTVNIGKTNPNIIIFNINVLMLFLIPLYYDLAIFIRIFRNLSLVNVFFLLNYVNSKEDIHLPFDKLLIFIYLLFSFFFFIYPVMQDSLIPLFKFNLFFP